MRWLQVPNDFYAATGTMRLNANKGQGRAHHMDMDMDMDMDMALHKHPRWVEVWGRPRIDTVEGF